LGSLSTLSINIGRLLFKVSSKEPTIRVNGRKITIIPNSASNEGTKLFYTLDGTKPSSSSYLYERPIYVPNGVTQVKAIAKEPEENKMPSMVVSANVYKGQLNKPIIHYKKGLVSMESTDDATIYYTTNGEDPNAESLKYEFPFMVEDVKKFHIKAICIKEGFLNSDETEIKRPILIMS
jgi:hypothetical protein